MPDSMRSWGELTAPAQSTTSRSARTVRARAPSATSTPVARPPSTTTRRTGLCVAIARLRRRRTGRRKAVAAEQRLPRSMVKS